MNWATEGNWYNVRITIGLERYQRTGGCPRAGIRHKYWSYEVEWCGFMRLFYRDTPKNRKKLQRLLDRKIQKYKKETIEKVEVITYSIIDKNYAVRL